MNLLIVTNGRENKYLNKYLAIHKNSFDNVRFGETKNLTAKNYDLGIVVYDEENIRAENYIDLFHIKSRLKIFLLVILENATARDKINLFAYGMNSYIDTPFTAKEIDLKIKNLVREKRVMKYILNNKEDKGYV